MGFPQRVQPDDQHRNREAADDHDGRTPPGAFHSGYNNSGQYQRYWELADVHKDGSVYCKGKNWLVGPNRSEPNFHFPTGALGGY
jgi:hypothetical protein